jgi:hypothetical protein
MGAKAINFAILTAITSILVGIVGHQSTRVMALPPPEEIPEEILRTEIFTAARSPVDGKLLTAAEYAQLQAQLQESPPPKLSTKIRENIFLLNLRKILLQLFPFLDI